MRENICTLCNDANSANDQYCNMDFTPDELLQIKAQYVNSGNMNRCPFCYAETKADSPLSIDFRHTTTTFECFECGAVWRNCYGHAKVEITRIPSRLTLCCQCDRLVHDAIDRLKKHGETYLSERLDKLFTGGFLHAMV